MKLFDKGDGAMVISKKEFYRERGQSYSPGEEAIARYRRALRWIEVKQGLVIRDIGCKFGMMYGLLLKHIGPSLDYIGIDISEEVLQRIPNYSSEKFYCHDVNQGLPFTDTSVDYLICLESNGTPGK